MLFHPHCPNYITCYFQSFHRGYTLLLLWALMNMKSINQVRDCSNGSCSKQAPFLHRSIRLRNGMDCLLHKRQLFLSKNQTENIRNELRLLHLHRTASPVCLLWCYQISTEPPLGHTIIYHSSTVFQVSIHQNLSNLRVVKLKARR